jgi:hypothetical protein
MTSQNSWDTSRARTADPYERLTEEFTVSVIERWL